MASRVEQCRTAVSEALGGRPISDDELLAIAELLEERARAKVEAGHTAAEADLAAAAEIAEDMKAAAAVERRNRKLNMATRARFRAHIDAAGPGNESAALAAYQVGQNKRFAGSRLSGDAKQKAWEGKLLGGMLRDLEALEIKAPELLASGDMDGDIARAMWEIGRDDGVGEVGKVSPSFEGPKEARMIAEVLHKWQEVAREAQNARGAWIRKMPGYITRQSHDEFRIRRMGYDEWRDFILPKLDPEQTFQGRNPEDVLKGAYEDIITGGHLAHLSDDWDDTLAAGLAGAANLAKRISKSRVLHFRSADDFMSYNGRLGRGSLMEGVMLGHSMAARNIGLMETWGTNPKAMFEFERRKLLEKVHGNPQRARAVRSKFHDWHFMELTGETQIPGNAVMARIGAGTRAIQSMAKLGGAVISGFSDVGLVAAETRLGGGTILQGYGTALGNLAKGRRRGFERERATQLGVGFDGMLGNIASRFTANDDLPGKMSKLMRLFFRFNGLQWWTDSHKTGVGLMVSRELGTISKNAWGDLDPDFQKTMVAYGFSEADWGRLRTMREMDRAADGRKYVDPTQARYLEGMTKRQREDLETKVRAYIVDRVESAVPTPGARQRALINMGTQSGTIPGEIVRFIGQFKQFPVTIANRVLGRTMYGKSSAAGLAHLILSTTVLGYGAMTAKDMLKGREPRDPTMAANWQAALLQGGGLGIYGDFLLGDYSRFGRSLLATLAGPTIGAIDDFASLYAGLRDGEPDAAKAWRFLQSNTPFANLFYAKPVIDYAVGWHIQEALNPGALRRHERRLKREQGQSYFLSPAAAVR